MRMRLPRPSIRLKLTALYGVVFFVAGAVVVVACYLLVQHSLTKGIDAANEVPAIGQLTDYKSLPASKPLGIVGADGEELTVGDLQERLAAQQEQLRESTMRMLLVQSLVAIGAIGVVGVGSGWLLAGRVLRPLHRITGTARAVAERNLHERIRMDGPRDELKELADTFDAMLERLDRAFDGQRHFVANASHELRTPITVSRTLVQVALAGPEVSADILRLGHKLLEVNARQERMIDGLLTLASTEQGIEAPTPVDLAEIVESVVQSAMDEAEMAEILVGTDLAPASALGDAVLLDRLVQNLVHNGLRHNVAGGWLRIRTDSAVGLTRLTVSNGGRLLTDAEIELIFEPFRRLGQERTGDGNGVGLGLSIVRSVVRAHRGQVTAVPGETGGLVVTVTLPAR